MTKKNGKRRGRRPTHRWLEWFGKRGTVTTLKKGTDYHCAPHGIASEARKVASRLRISLSVHITDEVVTITNKGPLR